MGANIDEFARAGHEKVWKCLDDSCIDICEGRMLPFFVLFERDARPLCIVRLLSQMRY